MPALDGLRGCAVLMVFYYHTSNSSEVPWRFLGQFGWAGVDLFFVLSGYLITNILIKNRKSPGYYKSFYMRRALRIAPVYYLALLIVLVLQPLIYHHLHPLRLAISYNWRQEIFYWLNLSNLRSAFFPIEIPLASIYWSLAIEEQFYAFWPFIIRRFTTLTITTSCLTALAASVLLRSLPVVQSYNHQYNNLIYRLTPFHLDGLLFGALLAIYLRTKRPSGQIRGLTLACFVFGLLLLLVATKGLQSPDSPGMSRYGFTAVALIFTSMVLLAVAPQGRFGHALNRCMSWKLLRSFGKYSYFIYVFHPLVLYSLGHVLESLTHTLNRVLAIYVSSLLALCVCYGAAWCSWRLIEAPILSWKRLFPYQRKAEQPLDSPKQATT